jgi:microcystin-dependent protein
VSEPFIAEIRIFAGNFAPRGWAQCNGQLLPIAQNTALFSLIGTTYGGDGRTTTGLPNMQGRAPMHPGRGPGLTTRRLGQKGGLETVPLSVNQIPAHTHAMKGSGPASTNVPTDAGHATNPAVRQYHDATNLVDMASTAPNTSLAENGGSGFHNNLPPYLTMNFIIALVGLYPSRS